MRCVAWLTIFLVFAGFDARAASPPLQSYNIVPGTASIIGFSIGGFMAVQTSVAYSGLFPAGLGVLAGGPFDCARNQQEELCRSNLTPDITTPTADMKSWSGNLIDDVANLAKMKVYIWVGTNDQTVGPNPSNALDQQLSNFVPAASIRYDVIQGADHTIQYGGQDGTVNALNWIYGPLNPPASSLSGQLVEFDQSAFSSIGMDPNGFLYVPAACANGAACKLVVYFHGSEGNYNAVGTDYFAYFGLNYYADTNNLIILYPQTIIDAVPHLDLTNQTVINTYGFWDYRGMYGANYDQHGGAQIAAIAAMAQKIMGAAGTAPQSGFWWNPAQPGNGYSIEVSPTDGSLYVTAYRYDATGTPVWYASALTQNSGKVYVGGLNEYQGGPQNALGTLSLFFPTPTTAEMSISAPGLDTSNFPLQRLQFSTNAANAQNNSLPVAPTAQTGWWWNPAQPGTGWFLEVQNSAMTIAGYTYGGNGDPLWYAAQNTLTTDTSFSGNFGQAGITVNFSAPDTATLTLQNGVSIPIQRYHF